MRAKKEESQKSPIPERDQDYPAPERPPNVQEEAEQSIQEMEEPPQAEGDRESADR